MCRLNESLPLKRIFKEGLWADNISRLHTRCYATALPIEIPDSSYYRQGGYTRGWMEFQYHPNGSAQSHFPAKAKGTLTLHPLSHVTSLPFLIQNPTIRLLEHGLFTYQSEYSILRYTYYRADPNPADHWSQSITQPKLTGSSSFLSSTTKKSR